MRHSLSATILVLALVAQIGCTSSRFGKMSAPAVLPPPPRETVRSGLGKVAVTSGRFAPTFDIVGGPAKEGAGRAAARGAVTGAQVAWTAGNTPYLGVFAILLLPVAVAVGAIAGASMAEPAVKKIEEREDTASQVVAARRIQEDLRDRVTAVGRDQTPHTFTVLADRGPSPAADERPDYPAVAGRHSDSARGRGREYDARGPGDDRSAPLAGHDREHAADPHG